MAKKSVTEQDNFSYLLTSLLSVLLLSAISEQLLHLEQSYIVGALVVFLSISVLGVSKNKVVSKGKLYILCAIFLIALISAWMDSLNLDILQLVLILAFLLYTLKSAARQVLFSGEITGNNIVGSICLFLLFGLIWSFIYLINLQIFPDSFNGIEPAPWDEQLGGVIYYSFITLTTIGYGEITPALPIPRFFAYLEAIVGQFYMAVLVASLVGAHMSQKENKD